MKPADWAACKTDQKSSGDRLKKGVIGMIVPTVDNSFFSSLVCEVEKYMAAQGYLVLTASVGNQADREKEYLQKLAEMSEGLICVSGLNELPENLLSEGFPLVWVDRRPRSSSSIPWIANDDARAMHKAAKDLIEKGCREIVLLPGFQAEDEYSPRIEGYRQALEDYGLKYKEENILRRQAKKSSEAESEELIEKLLKDGRKIDGVIASSDRAAFGVMSALNKVGYYVPEDVRLMAFDNSPFAAIGPASLSAIDRHPDVLAQKACQVLLGLIHQERDVLPETIVDVELVERTSTR